MNEMQLAGGVPLAPTAYSLPPGALSGTNNTRKRPRSEFSPLYNSPRPRQPMYHGMSGDVMNPGYNKFDMMNFTEAGLQVSLPDQHIRLPSAQTLLKKEPHSPPTNMSGRLEVPFVIPENKDSDRSSMRNLAMSLASSMLKADPQNEMNRERADSIVQDLLHQSALKNEKSSQPKQLLEQDFRDFDGSVYLEPSNESESR